MIPLSSFSEARLISAQISSYVASFSRVQVRSTTETSGTGTRKAIPVSFPLSAGRTFPTAFAAPVLDGITLAPQLRPPRQSFLDGPSTGSWVAVTAWTVVMRPSLIPNFLLTTIARGARQFVVQEALEMTFIVLGSYVSRLQPQTNIGASADGAEMMTRLQPPVIWSSASFFVVKRPVHSSTMSTWVLPHGISSGFIDLKTEILFPLTVMESSEWAMVPSKRPCTVSYLSMYSMYSQSVKGSLIATTWTPSMFRDALRAILPMRPNPLIPRRIGILDFWAALC
eukprot:XP_001705043.1 Hypothetical protein GL50803_20836 [Giardia lamblia ATCC 50803]